MISSLDAEDVFFVVLMGTEIVALDAGTDSNGLDKRDPAVGALRAAGSTAMLRAETKEAEKRK